jgi:hypothetical protein
MHRLRKMLLLLIHHQLLQPMQLPLQILWM